MQVADLFRAREVTKSYTHTPLSQRILYILVLAKLKDTQKSSQAINRMFLQMFPESVERRSDKARQQQLHKWGNEAKELGKLLSDHGREIVAKPV